MSRNFAVFTSLAFVLAVSRMAIASTVVPFSFTAGDGTVTASGAFTLGSAPPSSVSTTAGVYEITGITGTFSDTTSGVSGAITGLYQPTYTIPPAFTFNNGMSYDDLFYTEGNSPMVCPPPDPYPFFGGDFDIYGVVFTVSGGDGAWLGSIWSDGVIPNTGLVYAAGDADYTTQTVLDDPSHGTGVTGAFQTTPEPGSILLIASGLLSLSLLRRKARPA